jgi:DNA-binding response OmpR family regulator
LDGAPLDLSRREFDLLHYPALHADQVVTRRDLLTNVWHMPYGGADKTVDVHVSWLRRKLGKPRSSLVTCIPSRGRDQAQRARMRPRVP